MVDSKVLDEFRKKLECVTLKEDTPLFYHECNDHNLGDMVTAAINFATQESKSGKSIADIMKSQLKRVAKLEVLVCCEGIADDILNMCKKRDVRISKIMISSSNKLKLTLCAMSALARCYLAAIYR